MYNVYKYLYTRLGMSNYLTPKQIADHLGETVTRVNKALTLMGYQEKRPKEVKYEPTDTAIGHFKVKAIGTNYHLLWDAALVDEIATTVETQI